MTVHDLCTSSVTAFPVNMNSSHSYYLSSGYSTHCIITGLSVGATNNQLCTKCVYLSLLAHSMKTTNKEGPQDQSSTDTLSGTFN